MTHKEKAEELLDRFIDKSVVIDEDVQYYHPKPYSLAKQCALIAIREMIEMCEFDCIHDPKNQRNIDKLNYLDEVEKELEKL
jgi:hypothetical protein